MLRNVHLSGAFLTFVGLAMLAIVFAILHLVLQRLGATAADIAYLVTIAQVAATTAVAALGADVYQTHKRDGEKNGNGEAKK